MADGKAHINGSHENLPLSVGARLSPGLATPATRPSEIEFVEEGGLRGIVVHRT